MNSRRFTLHQGNSLEGWLKLGTAQSRLNELAAAEKSLTEARRISPQNPEVLNDLGVVQMKRNRPKDAAGYFSEALKQQPNYAPALLNYALLAQGPLNNHPLALEKYREYLALKPQPAKLGGRQPDRATVGIGTPPVCATGHKCRSSAKSRHQHAAHRNRSTRRDQSTKSGNLATAGGQTGFSTTATTDNEA